ncbi:MAG: hypothetical protein MJ112_06685 [Lachnospiraceae bacterium]|nr:hypothetical protein [Lachnospiraceae bacterium]
MNRFNKTSLANRIKESVNIPLLGCIIVVVLFLVAVQGISGSSYFDERAALESAIEKDIIHCYALEGFYPPSIAYMEENYGLTFNHDRFTINYERMGSNTMPTYIIIDRGGK